ncbi:winged helix-turn-helix transcriptional regulator [Fusibacter paucivorans]|uniref:Winged helix-turn-helix transcriptional regulator n=1 Tax=Fusibacter paucivorans TaxID=76009 RepID=A0ABS5PRI7_9FIRM|nr:winged helix-turn-helix domain-containing protein [Fusibacter paucivorans]MBS7527688.1 winged helix-turn-helix transcriptional regulator [Fusibacter paucivorans]
MKKQYTVSVESNLYLETIFHIEDNNPMFSDQLRATLSENERSVLTKMQNDKSFSHSEFIVFSDKKDFDSVVDFIRNLDIREYAYYCNHENTPLEAFQSIDEEDWINARDGAIAIINSAKILLNFDDSVYEEKINQISDDFQELSPLNIAQKIMGKKFRRISDYKYYYFVPIVSIEKSMRLFNDDELWTIFPNHLKAEALTIEQIEKIMKVMSDSTRLKIIKMLSHESLYGKEIAERLGLKAPTVTHHIMQLIDVGLLSVEQVAQIKYFSLNQINYDTFIEALNAYRNTL